MSAATFITAPWWASTDDDDTISTSVTLDPEDHVATDPALDTLEMEVLPAEGLTEAHDAPPISGPAARRGAHSPEVARMAAELSAAAVDARWESLRRTARRAATRADARQ